MKTFSSKLLFYVKKKYTQISSEGATDVISVVLTGL